MDYKRYRFLAEGYAKKYALLNDDILQDTILDAFERNNLSEEDAAVITVCISIKSAKDTAKRMRRG